MPTLSLAVSHKDRTKASVLLYNSREDIVRQVLRGTIPFDKSIDEAVAELNLSVTSGIGSRGPGIYFAPGGPDGKGFVVTEVPEDDLLIAPPSTLVDPDSAEGLVQIVTNLCASSECLRTEIEDLIKQGTLLKDDGIRLLRRNHEVLVGVRKVLVTMSRY